MKKDYKDIAINEKHIDNFLQKKILITGANGLIGGALAEFFVCLNENYFFGIDIYLTSLSKKPERIKHLLSREDVKYVSIDLSKNNEITGVFDYCFYCSGYAQPAKFLDRPIETINLNIEGLYKTLENVYKQNTSARSIFLSSSEVYSANKSLSAHKESDDIVIDQNNKRNF